MTRAENIAQVLAATGFVTSSLTYALFADPAPSEGMGAPAPAMRPGFPAEPVAGGPFDLARLYLQPDNVVMFLLLLSLWLMLVLDAIGNTVEPYRGHGRVTPALVIALLSGAAWPWVMDLFRVLGAGLAVTMMIAALLAARRMAGVNRPAIGFLAGWSTGIAVAVVAGMIAALFGLRLSDTAALAILPSALIAILLQGRIGSAVSYTVALIWAFCGVAATTMGSNPMVALAAILGIAALSTVLVRAAS